MTACSTFIGASNSIRKQPLIERVEIPAQARPAARDQRRARVRPLRTRQSWGRKSALVKGQDEPSDEAPCRARDLACVLVCRSDRRRAGKLIELVRGKVRPLQGGVVGGPCATRPARLGTGIPRPPRSVPRPQDWNPSLPSALWSWNDGRPSSWASIMQPLNC